MATILHIYSNSWSCKAAFKSSAIPGLRRQRDQVIVKPNGDTVKFAVVTNGREAECLAGLTLREVFWHYQPTPELESRINRWLRQPAEKE